MQDIIFSSSAQACLAKGENSIDTFPSLSLLEEGLRVRLERTLFTAQVPLELFREDTYCFTPQSVSAIIDHLEIILIELRHLINELGWLQWIQTKMMQKKVD